MDLIQLQFESLPAVGAMTSFGQWLIIAGVAFSLTSAMLKVALGQPPRLDQFVEPVVRGGIAMVVLMAVPEITSWMATTAKSLEGSVVSANSGADLEHSILDSIRLIDLVSMLGMVKAALLAFMYVARLLLLGVVWPLLMQLLVVVGLVAVPLSIFPGIGSSQGWVRSLIEVALWPVVFALLSALMMSSFSHWLGQGAQAEGDLFGSNVLNPAAFESALKMLALALGYCGLLFVTPLVASAAVRSTPIGPAAMQAVSTSMAVGTGLAMAATGVGLGLAGGAAGSAALGAAGASLRGAGIGQMARGIGGNSPTVGAALRAAGQALGPRATGAGLDQRSAPAKAPQAGPSSGQ